MTTAMTRLLRQRLGVAAGLAGAALAAPPVAAAQDSVPPPANTITAAPAYDTDRWLPATEEISVTLSRAPDPGAGRIAVFLGRTDVTALTRRQGTAVMYRPAGLDLPTGETELSVFLVEPGGAWTELGRFPALVLTRGGFRQLSAVPAVELLTDGELDGRQELTLNVGMSGAAARPGWSVRTRAAAVGVTRDEQRLRFGERGADAPAMDLSDYLVELESGPVSAGLGHVSFGGARHLISGFASRGASGAVRVGQTARLSLAALNGSNVVGWSNPFGLAQSDHRMFAGSVALELVPAQPGLVRIEATALDGSLLPQQGYSQGVVNDAETGRGVGVEVALREPGGRAEIGGGFTRATFTNPADPLLAQGDALVPVRSTTRNARYLETAVHLFRNAPVAPGVPMSLSTAFRHERIDPLYRSVAAPLQSDVQRNVFQATAAVGQLALQYTLGRSRDNLDRVASILTSRTREHGVAGSLPLGAVFRASADAWWWPALAATWQSTHQRGGGIPVDGGFSESHIPDQYSTNVTLSLGWRHAAWDLSWQHNASRQDNRQPGREAADFHARVHAVSLGLTPSPTVRVSLDLSEERQRSLELDLLQRVRRVGVSGDWQPLRHSTLQGSLALTHADDRPITERRENLEMRLEASQGFNLYRRLESGPQARAFLRVARSRVWFGGPAAGLIPNETVWTAATGLSLRIF